MPSPPSWSRLMSRRVCPEVLSCVSVGASLARRPVVETDVVSSAAPSCDSGPRGARPVGRAALRRRDPDGRRSPAQPPYSRRSGAGTRSPGEWRAGRCRRAPLCGRAGAGDGGSQRFHTGGASGHGWPPFFEWMGWLWILRSLCIVTSNDYLRVALALGPKTVVGRVRRQDNQGMRFGVTRSRRAARGPVRRTFST